MRTQGNSRAANFSGQSDNCVSLNNATAKYIDIDIPATPKDEFKGKCCYLFFSSQQIHLRPKRCAKDAVIEFLNGSKEAKEA